MTEQQEIEILIAAYSHRELAQMYLRLLKEKNEKEREKER